MQTQMQEKGKFLFFRLCLSPPVLFILAAASWLAQCEQALTKVHNLEDSDIG